MHLGVFAVMDTFDHFRTNKRAARNNSIDGDHLTKMLSTESTGVDVMVSKGTFEADIEDDIIVDVCMLGRPKGERSFLQSAVERWQEFSRFIKDTRLLAERMRSILPIA